MSSWSEKVVLFTIDDATGNKKLEVVWGKYQYKNKLGMRWCDINFPKVSSYPTWCVVPMMFEYDILQVLRRETIATEYDTDNHNSIRCSGTDEEKRKILKNIEKAMMNEMVDAPLPELENKTVAATKSILQFYKIKTLFEKQDDFVIVSGLVNNKMKLGIQWLDENHKGYFPKDSSNTATYFVLPKIFEDVFLRKIKDETRRLQLPASEKLLYLKNIDDFERSQILIN